MSTLARCVNGLCPRSEECWRYTARPGKREVVAAHFPRGGECVGFIAKDTKGEPFHAKPELD